MQDAPELSPDAELLLLSLLAGHGLSPLSSNSSALATQLNLEATAVADAFQELHSLGYLTFEIDGTVVVDPSALDATMFDWHRDSVRAFPQPAAEYLLASRLILSPPHNDAPLTTDILQAGALERFGEHSGD